MSDQFLDNEVPESNEILASPTSSINLASLGLDPDVTFRLSQYLNNVERGSDVILMTPLGKDNKPTDILRAWDEIFQSNSHKINKDLLEMELNNRAKFGPRSIAKPWRDLKPSVYSYFEKSNFTVSSRALYASRAVSGSKRLRPISIDKAMDYLKNSTNSGLPYYTRKSKVKLKVKSRFNDLLSKKYPCILFERTQEGNKTRAVWGYPIADTLLEMQYYRPLLDYQRKLSWRSAIVGPDEVDRQITRIMRKANYFSDHVFLSIDFSSYDASVGKELQSASFNYIKDLFQFSCSKDLNFIRDRFNTIGLLTPDGVISGSHGVPSGSTFTNEVDSISQYLIATSSGCVHADNIQIQGDDGVYLVASEDLDELIKSFELAGLNVNKEKSRTSRRSCTYLQNLYHPDYHEDGLIRGVYPTYRALNRLIYQERWSQFEDFDLEGKDYYSIRAYSILENCKFHPLFEELVEFILKLDKYSLRISRGADKKYVSMLNNSSGSSGFLVNQRGDDVSGLRNFRSYKLVDRIRP